MADLPANNAKIHVVKKELLKSIGFCRQNWEFQCIRRERETRISADKRPRSRITYILEGEYQHLAAGPRTSWLTYFGEGHPTRPCPHVVNTLRRLEKNTTHKLSAMHARNQTQTAIQARRPQPCKAEQPHCNTDVGGSACVT